MKLSNMPLDKARDCLVELAPHLSVLVSDPDVLAFFDDSRERDNPIVEIINFAGKVMREHYETLLIVLSLLTGEGVDVIRAKPVGEVIALARSVYDKDLKSFFTS